MTWLPWLLSQFRPDAPLFWVAVDLLVVAGLPLLGARLPEARRPLIRAVRLLLVPYAALMVGVVSPQRMGLAGIDWQTSLTLGLGFAAAVLVLLGAARLATGGIPGAEGPSSGTSFALLLAGAEQFNWLFLRAAMVLVVRSWPAALDSGAYWALWLATLPALPGIWVSTPHALGRLTRLIALVATAILTFYTRNFWLAWMLHCGILLIMGMPDARPARSLHPRP